MLPNKSGFVLEKEDGVTILKSKYGSRQPNNTGANGVSFSPHQITFTPFEVDPKKEYEVSVDIMADGIISNKNNETNQFYIAGYDENFEKTASSMANYKILPLNSETYGNRKFTVSDIPENTRYISITLRAGVNADGSSQLSEYIPVKLKNIRVEMLLNNLGQ